jgi:pimeloyl-ACP methyl ester carboxylesterase
MSNESNPFKLSHLEIQSSGEDYPHSPFLNYQCSGSGTPVILIHGLAASLHDWDYLIPDLVSAGFETCAVDLLGHGDSYCPSGLGEYTVQNVYSHLQTLIGSLFPTEPVFLIGHSLGAYLALMHGLINPSRIKGLILVNPYFSKNQISVILRFIFRYPLSNTTLIQLTPYWLFRSIIDLTSLEFGLKYRYRYNLPEQVRVQTATDYKRAAPGIYNIPRTMVDLEDQFSRISFPTLLVWGQNDRTLNPLSFNKLTLLIPNIKTTPIPNCGHVPHQSEPAIFNPLVMDFLTGNNS